ncbi:outer membrane lipoprotein Blc [Entomohabitans teleogrylli]|uniref:outer membrane lipoprotein Blc n=1 Tax=Entomohabitans teleogrylli TaxID=1384589 RepID=UPI00073D6008|nr:outer membrane lipoprotein Blc [Entomohabitans teleogrylli]
MKIWPIVTVISAAVLITACQSPTPPRGVTVVENFDAQRYLGTWYEIARLENRFEKGLEQVTATYSLNNDGTLRVVNRGFDPNKQRWQQSTGKAKFTGKPTRAALKVSFFGPFYGGYNVIALDNEYRYALVCGPNRDYLWLLSRTPAINADVKQELLSAAARQGFAINQLRWVKQEKD